MRRIAIAAVLVLLSANTRAGTGDAVSAPTPEEMCRQAAAQHNMAADKVDAWVERCAVKYAEHLRNQERAKAAGSHRENAGDAKDETSK